MVVAGCGGGNDRLSAADYVRQASDVCRHANRLVVSVDVPSLTDKGPATRALARVLRIQRDSVAELRELRPPEHLADIVERWTALLDQGGDELELMNMRLRAGRSDDALEYGAEATTLLDRATELIAPLRVTSCRGPVLPTV
jgi:hypothetical protein